MPKALSDAEMEDLERNTPLSDEQITAMEAKNPRMPFTPVESFGVGALQGASLGFAPQIEGAARAVGPALDWQAVTSDEPSWGGELPSGQEILDNYRNVRDAAELRKKHAQSDNPKSYTAGSAAGAIGTGFIPGVGALNAGAEAGLATRLGLAGVTGAIGGAGNSEADLTRGEFGKLGKDMVSGAATGVVTQGALSGLGTALGSYKPMKAVQELADNMPVFKGDKIQSIPLYNKFADALPIGLDKTAKFIAPVVAPPIDAFLSQGAVKAASTLIKVLESEGAENFAKIAQPIVEAAQKGNTTAAATLFLIEKQHQQAQQGAQQ